MYSVLLDNVFLENDFIDLYVDKENGLSYRRIFPVERKCLDFLKNPGSINSINFKYVLELVNHLLHINDYNNLVLLLDLAYNKKYLNFCDLFYSPLYNNNFNPNLIYNDYINNFYNHYNYHLCNKTLPDYARYYSLKK
jgi:hypothetical protein